MARRKKFSYWCMCSIALFAGCAQPNTDMSAMKPPERAKELDLLEVFVGSWTMTGEDKMGDKTIATSGTFSCAWECDRRFMLEKVEVTMGEMGKMNMLIVHSWDAKDKEFESHFFDSRGMASEGELSFDQKTNTWRSTGSGPDPMTGKRVKYLCNFRFVDNSTIELTSRCTDTLGRVVCEGKGTAKRS